MFKFLVIVIILVFALIYLGNYLDLKYNRISRAQFNNKNRLGVFLLFIVIAVLVYLRRH